MRKNSRKLNKKSIVIFALVIISISFIIVNVISQAANEKTNVSIENAYTVKSSDGINVPVPAGFSASQIPGEDSVKTGFVIYEGDIDWSFLGNTSNVALMSLQKTKNKTTNELEENSIKENNTTIDNTNLENNTVQNIVGNTTLENTIVQNVIDNTTLENNTDQNIIGNTTLENTKAPNIVDNTVLENTIAQNVVDNTTLENNIAQNNVVGNTTLENNTSPNMVENTVENAIIDTTSKNNIKEDSLSLEETTENVATAGVASAELNQQIFNLQCSTNQYVWVPIENVSNLYGVDLAGKLWGKLYAVNPDNLYKWGINWTETNGKIVISSLTDTNSYREPDILTLHEYESGLAYNYGIMVQYKFLKKELEQFFYETIESIKKYGGFYIGRYETGGLSGTTVVRRMNTDISNQNWYTMYEKCKRLDEGKNSVTTSMIWGSLWDETLKWFVNSGAKTNNQVYSDSTGWANYDNATFVYYNNLNMGTATKAGSSANRVPLKIPTGSADYAKANNIYDMAGNMKDYTLEAYQNSSRICRGGGYKMEYNSYPVVFRDTGYPASVTDDGGCRAMLIIN